MPDEPTTLNDRAALIAATIEDMMNGAAGDTIRTDTATWTTTITDPAELARGWSDATVGRKLRYCPEIIAAATSPYPLTGDGSVVAYIELVRLIWEYELVAIIDDGITALADLREIGVGQVADVAIEAVEFMAQIEMNAMDDVAQTEPGDGSWATDLGL